MDAGGDWFLLRPDRKLDSGLIICDYDVADGSKVRLGFPGFAPILYAHQSMRMGISR